MNAPYDIFDYPSYWKGRKYENEADKMAIKKLLARVKKREALIDIAGGFGRLSSFLACEFKKILLIDQSKELIGEAKKYLLGYKNIEIKLGDCQALPAKNISFDLALMIRIVHHLENPEKAFREAYRVLKPQGFLILEFANKLHFLSYAKAMFSGDLDFRKNLSPLEKRSQEAIRKEMITFCNHHPKAIEKSLEKVGFEVIDRLSVSNYRSEILKRLIPFRFLLVLESLFQRPLAKINFGPSIFLLAWKK